MRTTVRIDDDLMRELKHRAEQTKLSLTRLLNQVLRQGLAAPPKKRAPFHQKTYDLGVPLVNLDKALSLAFEWEDEEIMRKMAEGK